MARIKHYRTREFATRDPNNPGRRMRGRMFVPSGTVSVTYSLTDYPGTDVEKIRQATYFADASGWIDVPPEVEAHYCGFPGWMNEEQVAENIAAGFIDDKDGFPETPPAEAPAPKVEKERPFDSYDPPPPPRKSGRDAGRGDGAEPAAAKLGRGGVASRRLPEQRTPDRRPTPQLGRRRGL